MNKTFAIKPLYAWGILLFLSAIWGSSFILIKKSLLAFSADEVGALRIFIASLAFIPFIFLRWNKIDWSKFKYYCIVGIFGNAIPAYLFALAETQISSSMAGVLNGLTPLFTLLLGILVFGSTFKKLQYLGVFIGFLGAALLMLYGAESDSFSNMQYGLLIVLGTVCYGISVNVVNKYLNKSDAILISSLAFIIIGPLAGIYLLTTDVVANIQATDGLFSLMSVCILSIVGTFVATIIFFRLVQLTDALYASSVAFIIPIVALGWGLLDGEFLSIVHVIGMGMILSGVYLIRK